MFNRSIDQPVDFHYYADNVQFQLAAEAAIKDICLAMGHVYRKPVAGVSVLKPVASKVDSGKKRLVSHHAGKLRFYNKPSWPDRDVFRNLSSVKGSSPSLKS